MLGHFFLFFTLSNLNTIQVQTCLVYTSWFVIRKTISPEEERSSVPHARDRCPAVTMKMLQARRGRPSRPLAGIWDIVTLRDVQESA